MDCPKCSLPLTKIAFGAVALDECRSCRGIWFDAGEIEEVRDEVAPDLRWMDLEIWRDKADFRVESDPLYCPRCATEPLTAVTDTELNTTVRFCAQCRGSWLNVADLEDVIATLRAEADSRSVSEYVRESLKQAADLIVGEKDTLSRWKDLKAVLRLLKYRVFVENPTLSAIMRGLQKGLPL